MARAPSPPLSPVSPVSPAEMKQEALTADSATIEEKPKTKGGWGTIKSSIQIPNLNTIFDEESKEETDEKELVQGNVQHEVSLEQFNEKWISFANQLKSESKITLYTIMTASVPVLEGNTIRVGVENSIQMGDLREGKIDILNYLRVELQNFALDIEGVMVEQITVRKPYTSIEKYQAMVEKNPALDLLRQKFDLGLS